MSSHDSSATPPRRKKRLLIAAGGVVALGVMTAAIIDLTLADFHLSGTQIGDVSPAHITTSDNCFGCHGPYFDEVFGGYRAEPMSRWKGSLMGNAGRDPLFYAQMTNANQDVANAGYFCMRCHMPMTFVTGHAEQADGSTIDERDMDGISCHFCHSMVDPIYKEGVSPPEDAEILKNLAEVPEYYGNAMFVLDPEGRRRGPREDVQPMHEFIHSPFHKTSDMCGTCHDVGNVAITKRMDGTYRYNAVDQPTPDEDPWTQFPLERTYTEWKLSAFADGGVDMGGRFGGSNSSPVVSTCQDCHMPKTFGDACYFGPARSDLARHDFAGSAAWVLEIIGIYYEDDPNVDQRSLQEGIEIANDMLRRAASLELGQRGSTLDVRVINETGHKLPTGHIEGRRVFVNVKFFDDAGALVDEYGHYDYETAHLDEESTRVYEMHVGLSEHASDVTGLPAGVTTHMALADTIMKDNRIPPRGFNNAAFEAGGAPVVGHEYADGQYWDDIEYDIPSGAATAEVTVYYQIVTRHYIEALRDGNHTDHWGDTLYDLWQQTDKAPPTEIVSRTIQLQQSGGGLGLRGGAMNGGAFAP